MPIITLARAKELLQIATADTSQDTLITNLIPSVQAAVLNYCKNYFINDNTVYISSNISFAKTAKTITHTDDGESFIDEGFYNGVDILVSGSKFNDGIYIVKTVAADSLLLETTENLKIDEAEDNTIVISRIDFPKDLELGVAQLINFNLAKQGKLVESESLPGGYSVKYKTDKNLMSNYFASYRKPFF